MNLGSARRKPAGFTFLPVGPPVALLPLAALLCFSQAFAQLPAGAASASRTSAPKARATESTFKSGWSELTPAQQVALGPLTSAWSRISEGQKRKWIALSRNYPALSEAERTTLHGRMTEWAALSPAQRSQARLSFAQTKQLSATEKKTQWQAYQALSADQKKELASGAHPRAVGAAPAAVPVPPSKLAVVPITRSETHVPQAGAVSSPRSLTAPSVAGVASAPLAPR